MGEDREQTEQERAEERAVPLQRTRYVDGEIEPRHRTEDAAEADHGEEVPVGGVERRDLEDEGAEVAEAAEFGENAEDADEGDAAGGSDEGADE